MIFSHARLLWFSLAFAVVAPTWSKKVQGRTTLAPQQARVVTKFCFDYNHDCTEQLCPGHQIPGKFNFNIYEGRPAVLGNWSDVHIALLDDEYFSFTEVSKVWDDLNCHEILKAAKRTFRIDWVGASASSPGAFYSSDLFQKVRPRWWYIAFVSCMNQEVTVSYDIHLQNLLQGWYGEFSMDMMGVYSLTWFLCFLFVGLTFAQLDSLRSWAALVGASWLRLHPALLLLWASSCFAAVGEACWMTYFSQFQQNGVGNEWWAVLGRVWIIASKMVISLLLILFSRGQCVCTADIAWSQNREVIWGLVLFAFVCFVLELWGDSEYRSTSVEYVYDTRAGCVLVTFDGLLLWLYTSRSWRTFQSETRAKPRLFYRSYSILFGCWFAALPVVAIVASLVAPWVRWRVAFAINSCAHVTVLALLIYTFRPVHAAKLYEMQVAEYASLSHKELSEI